MKRLLLMGTLIMVFGANSAKGDQLDPLFGVIFPQIDFKYVEFIPNRHLHKNKPRYQKYDRQVKESSHFRIFYYPDETELAGYFLSEAETVYAEYNQLFRFNPIKEKIAMVVLNSSRHFEETNLVDGLIHPGLGGVTELLKRKRVTIAFRDSVSGFRKLLRHELTHRYQADLVKWNWFRAFRNDIPLWFLEGFADYRSERWSAAAEMLVRDAYFNNYLAHMSDHDSWSRHFLFYREGNYIAWFLDQEYGHKGEVMSGILRLSNNQEFPKAFAEFTGDDLEAADKKLFRTFEERYSHLRPQKDILDFSANLGEGIVVAAKGQFFLSRKRVGGRGAMFLNWTDGSNQSSKKLTEDGRFKNVVFRGFDFELESEFGFKENGASFASTSTLVYSVDVGGQDEIRIQQFDFDQYRKKFRFGKTRKFRLGGLRDIQHPIIMADGKIVFIGREKIFAEIYVFDPENSKLKKITSLRRGCNGLAYSPKFGMVASVENEAANSYDLVRVDLDSGEARSLWQTSSNEYDPVFSDDGNKLFYVSDQDGVPNIYQYDFENGTLFNISNAKIGVFRPRWFGSGGMLYNSFRNAKVEIQLVELPRDETAFVAKYEITVTTLYPSWDFSSSIKNGTVNHLIRSPDGGLGLAVVNKKLSLKSLAEKEPEVDFCAINHRAQSVYCQTLKEFEKVGDFEKMEFIGNDHVLFAKTKKIRLGDKDGPKYKEFYLLRVTDLFLTKLPIDKPRGLFTISTRVFKWAPLNDKFVWINDGVVESYEIASGSKTKVEGIEDAIDFAFIDSGSLLVLEGKAKRGCPRFLNLVHLKSNSLWKSEFICPAGFERNKDFFNRWQVFAEGKKLAVLTVTSKGPEYFRLWISDLALARSAPRLVAEFKSIDGFYDYQGSLVIEIKDLFENPIKVFVDPDGELRRERQSGNYFLVTASSRPLDNLVISSRAFDFGTMVSNLQYAPKKWPEIYRLNGNAGVVGGSGGIVSFVALNMLSLDEFNDKAFYANVLLSRFTEGYANIGYYDYRNGRSIDLDYWNFSVDSQRLEVVDSKNIFLHPFLNWDVNLTEQYVRVNRNNVLTDWWRTKLGTTFSVDTTVWDWHGPFTGVAAFSGVETTFNNQGAYQSVDLNLDARYYRPLTKRSSFALRLAGGKSFGPTPNNFIWGGNRTFRGIGLFSQAGSAYVLQSAEFRFPVFDAIGVKLSGPVDQVFQFLTRFMDVRGGIYNDIGDIWYEKPGFLLKGHQGFRLQHSAGYFFNVPTVFGLNLRWSKGIYGADGWNFWLGYNW